MDPEIVLLTIDGERLETTTDHPFYEMTSAPWLAVGQLQGRWTDAGELEVGDLIWQADGTTGIVESVVVVAVQQWMYNLTVAEAHTFFVGRQGWLVHNAGPCGLDWSIVSRSGETRIDHVHQHRRNNVDPSYHGVFYNDPVTVINRAWDMKGDMKPIKTEDGLDFYEIPFENVGYMGGYRGQGQNINYITILTRKGTNKIVTGYPGKNVLPKEDTTMFVP